MVSQNAATGGLRKFDGVIDSSLFQRACVLGTGYSWDKIRKSSSAFLLWHTEGQLAPANGASGAPLCLGRPSDPTSLAVVFQNFQQSCRLFEVSKYLSINNLLSRYSEAIIKAGFILPTEITEAEILSGEKPISTTPFHSLPVGHRGPTEHEHQRRVFSSIE